jgi:hypothetical protein
MSIADADFADIDELRCFATAIVADDRKGHASLAARQLTEHLIRKALIGVVNAGAPMGASRRMAVFSRFLQLHRDHVRREELEESDAGWPNSGFDNDGHNVKRALRTLPLELREAVLLVTLVRFTHEEAVEALDISMSQLIERLDKARRQLSQLLQETPGPNSFEPSARAPHLRVVK